MKSRETPWRSPKPQQRGTCTGCLPCVCCGSKAMGCPQVTRVQLSGEIAKATQRRADLVKQLKLSDRRATPYLDPALLQAMEGVSDE